jgi:putative acetyltransferase
VTALPIRIVDWNQESADGGYVALKSAFGQADEADLVHALEADGDLLAALVAEVDGVAVGAIAFSRVWLEHEGERVPAAALAPLGVTPAFQRRGVGAQLMREGLQRMQDQGERVILVLGDPGYYRRFGFSVALAEKVEAPWSGPHFQALTLGAPTPEGKAVYAKAFFPASAGESGQVNED